MLFGRGQLAAHIDAADYSENTYATLLYDYGFIMLALYIMTLVVAIGLLRKSSDKQLKKQAILVLVMLTTSLLYSMQYWGNIIFLVWTGVGIMIGRWDYVKQTEHQKGREIA